MKFLKRNKIFRVCCKSCFFFLEYLRSFTSKKLGLIFLFKFDFVAGHVK
jgi:hypothetical protein